VKVEDGASTRDAILDATEQLMLDEGYAAVTTRKVASVAGLRSNLLYYHFRTLDDLFVAVFQRLEDRYDARFARAIASDRPIRELWKLNVDAASTSLILEFKALATHRKAVRQLISRSARRDRAMHAAALAQILERRGPGPEELPPIVLAVLISSLARTLVTEQALEVADGHAETLEFIEHHLGRLEAPVQPVGGAGS
jgi:AcrR family transcriptional regulator